MSDQTSKKEFNLWKLLFLIENACVLVALIVVGVIMMIQIRNQYDPTPYVQSILDVKYKNNYDAYIDGGFGTIKDADDYRNDTVQYTLDYFAGKYQDTYDEEFMSNMNKVVSDGLNDICSMVDFEITGTEKSDEGNYTVTLSYRTLDFSQCDKNVVSEAVDQVFVNAEESYLKEGTIPTQDRFYADIVLTGFTSMYHEMIENPKYGEEKEVKIRFEKKEEGYVPKAEDIRKLDAALFYIDEEETFTGNYTSDDVVSKMVDTVFFIQAGEFANELLNGDNTLLENWLPDDAALSVAMRDQILRSMAEEFLSKKAGSMTDEEYAEMADAMSNLIAASKIELKSIKKTSDLTYKVTYKYQKTNNLNLVIPAYNKVINKKGKKIGKLPRDQYMVEKAKLFAEAVNNVAKHGEYDEKSDLISYEYNLAYGMDQTDFYEKVWASIF